MSNADIPLFALGVAEAAAAIATKALTARALAAAQLARVAATDHAIEAWATLDAAHVRREADRCDAARARGPLHGIGLGVKDIVATRALPTGYGSAAFAGVPSERDADCVTRLEAAGGYVFGKTVTTEVAFMQPGKTRNPWNAAHTPGGSSSGSAAAVAAGHVAGAIGTQTNGSVIRPAAYCGVVGFKPTTGRISYDGVHLFSETLDALGTLARSVRDAALIAAAIAREPGALVPVALDTPPRIAFLPEFPWTPIDAAVRDALASTVRKLETAGARVRVLTLPPSWHGAVDTLRTIMLAEAAVNLAPLRARSEAKLSQRLIAALDDGAKIGRARYEDALAQRQRMRDELTQLLDGGEAVACPPAPSTAPAGLATTGDPSCCTLWSLLGAPALTLPIGRAANGLPLGMQLGAAPGDDARLLSAAAWCEARLPFAGLVAGR